MRQRLLLAAALLVVLGGCGSDDDEATPATATAPTETVASEPYGEYEREVSQADLDRAGVTGVPGSDAPPPGTYVLVLNEGVIQVLDPAGVRFAQELTVTDGTLEIERYIGPERNAFCNPDGPSTYEWTGDGETLTLSPENEECPDRDSILTGEWTSSG